MEDLSQDEMRAFVQEAEEQLQLLDEDIIRLEKEANNQALLNEIFRAAHTLKGSSAMIGFEAMTGLTHHMEDALDRLRNGVIQVTPELVDALLLALDALQQLMHQFSGGAPVTIDLDNIVDVLGGFGTSGGGARPGVTGTSTTSAVRRLHLVAEGSDPIYNVSIAVSPDCDWAAVRMLQAISELAEAGEIIESVPSSKDIEEEKVDRSLNVVLTSTKTAEDIKALLSWISDIDTVSVERVGEEDDSEEPTRTEDLQTSATAGAPTGEAVQQQGQAKGEPAQSVRIDTSTLDALMNMVGELVTGRTQLAQLSRALSTRYRDDDLVEHLATTVPHLGRIVDELNERMMEARMLPIGLIFSKFPRMVRDLARSLGKDVDFVIEGAETEIDRSVIDRVRDPIVHMLRNAVDHGIESPAERRAAGKNPMATLRLTARHEQGSIFIAVSEDGKGIDAGKVRQAAVKKGLLTQEAADRLTNDEAAELIFLPGFSTAEKTTEVSGRGVGMDVVHRSIMDLGGSVIIETAVGAGTTFSLRLPLTLTTFGALLVSAEGGAFAIPLNSVQETIKLQEGAIHRVFGKEVLSLRGAIMPLIRLRRNGLIGLGDAVPGNHGFVVVLSASGKQLALGVDDLMAQQEVVVKPLEGHAGTVRGISGATILGDGSVALILDVQGLIRSSTHGLSVEAERTHGVSVEAERIAA